MSDDEILDGERSVNERYLRAMRIYIDGLADVERGTAVLTNSIWLGTAPNLTPPDAVFQPMIGRVALDYDDMMLGRDYYIGPWYLEFDGVVALNWSSKSAELFFRGRGSSWHDPDPATLSGRRSFEVRGMDLTARSDDLEIGVDPGAVFAGRSWGIDVPAPPGEAMMDESDGVAEVGQLVEVPAPEEPAGIVRPSGQGETTDAPGESSVEPIEEKQLQPSAAPMKSPPAGRVISGTAESDGEAGESPLRNEDLVRKALARPRSGRLSSVLATLQPDQYRMVSFSTDEHLVVQGHPGTGKTVVATHRAAFITHQQKEDRLERVALVGPTDGWARHVREVLDDLGAGGVEVISMTRLVGSLANGLTHPLHHDREARHHVSWETARIGYRAGTKLRKSATGLAEKRMRHVLDQLVRDTDVHKELVSDPKTSEWLLGAKSAEIAVLDRSYLLLAANIGLALGPQRRIGPFDHMIVDEAQDIRGAEWAILSRLLRQGGHWSLFGDMNQRRVDHTWASWPELAIHLEIGPTDDTPFVEHELRQGYRSTKEILAYAAGLLPRGARHLPSILHGPEPMIRKVRSPMLNSGVIAEASALVDRHSGGTVAVISVDPTSLRDAFLKAGWRKTAEAYELRDDEGRRLSVLMPVMARGLEFDGVVVVEPSDFPKNLGSHGRLYTALTRANRELVIVHAGPIPPDLKGRGQRAG